MTIAQNLTTEEQAIIELKNDWDEIEFLIFYNAVSLIAADENLAEIAKIVPEVDQDSFDLIKRNLTFAQSLN